MAARNLLLLSNSTVHGSGYLEWAQEHIKDFLMRRSVRRVLFVPYALRDMDSYTEKAAKKFTAWGFELTSIHQASDPITAVRGAEAIFVGGGNTFQLLKALYNHQLLDPIRHRVLKEGAPYIGSSAGTNVATTSINTTNDMPIVHPPSFNALSLVPININPHYIDANPANTHMGETREERIMQYHELPDVPPVLALREGSLLKVEGDLATLQGLYAARLFVRGKQPEEFAVNSDLSFLLK
ncbi:alpha-aspartyl dipeptidase-like [Portunus trituberculatus]|uniref:alpha-aspartyl dipeptidase-like n=1 Tax=Portunus trituberculatus TaxID=210409 RepID=UPI001E1D2036|nr:alpha-aspartyl dipeptidase-like [Portunus trituberculatus]XP_045133629.1 alpha-aspartyl dipeptidase-like [Portunus trituberculatus]